MHRPHLPLQTVGSPGIDINGLNKQDKQRIKEVGFDQWIDEITGHKKKKMNSPQQLNTTKVYTAAATRAINILAPVISSKVKPGSVGYPLAIAFFKLARENGNVVTYDQTAKLCPKYPGDPALWAREMGADVVTERKNKRYVVVKYV